MHAAADDKREQAAGLRKKPGMQLVQKICKLYTKEMIYIVYCHCDISVHVLSASIPLSSLVCFPKWIGYAKV